MPAALKTERSYWPSQNGANVRRSHVCGAAAIHYYPYRDFVFLANRSRWFHFLASNYERPSQPSIRTPGKSRSRVRCFSAAGEQSSQTRFIAFCLFGKFRQPRNGGNPTARSRFRIRVVGKVSVKNDRSRDRGHRFSRFTSQRSEITSILGFDLSREIDLRRRHAFPVGYHDRQNNSLGLWRPNNFEISLSPFLRSPFR